MTTPHKATQEQWAATEELEHLPGWHCLLELRDRIAALEDAANSKPTPNPSQIRSSAAGDLMQSVGAAICSIADCGDTPSNWAPEARAAILAVAGWFDAVGYGATASILRQELQGHV